MKAVTHFFAEQVIIAENKIAITDAKSSITFKELDKKSNAVTQYILESLTSHSQKSTIIGLCLKRNINLVIGLFGILKAGAAFLPLDPKEPQSRLSFMIQDANCPLVLTDQETISEHPWLTEFPNIILDDLETTDILLPLPNVTPEDLIYLIYTSGSTGKPKGVLCQHQAVINRFQWLWKNYPYSSDDICCQKAPIGYVDSIWELICPLLKGIPYHIISDEILFNPIKLLNYLAYHKITRIELVPSLLEIILQEITERNHQLPDLKLWVVSGDIIRPNLVNTFKTILPEAVLLNRFGSTEATSYLWYPAHLWNNDSQHIPIGKPVDNVAIYILDDNLQPVPKGQIAELYVSGLSLSYGYLNDAQLTKKKFIDNPFTKASHQSNSNYARMYKTGDLVRELPSGNIEYVERVDHQIKIHGYRIEPVEIEQALQQYPSIREARIILQSLNEERYLTAYYILKEDYDKLNVQEIKKHLANTLPPYVIPNFYVCLDKFPLNKNGKLDRSALPKPNFHEHVEHDETTMANCLEKSLITIWENILQIKNIEIQDNFFSLGGHSLLAMKMIAKIYCVLDVTLNITDIWHYPTIQTLAKYIQNLKNQTQEELEYHIHSQHLPLSAIEQELWFLNKFEQAKESSYHMHFVVELKGALNCDAVKASINYLVKHHSILRTVYLSGPDGLYRKILDYAEFDVPVVEIKAEQTEQNLQKYIAIPFNIETDILFRGIIFKLSTNKHILLIVQHHIIGDDGSVEILLSQLSILYEQYINNQSLHLPISKPYYEFALWQQQQISNNAYSKQLNYWKSKLSDTEHLNLITDFQRPDLRTTDGDIYCFSIDKLNAVKLQDISKSKHLSLFISLLSIVSVLLSRYAKQDDIIIGVPISLRDNPLFYDTIGILLNCITVRLKLNASLSFFDLLSYVKHVVTESLENKDLPFHLLVNELNLEITPGISPLFNTLFVYQDVDYIKKLELAHVESKFLDVHDKKSKFDLSFYFEKTRDQIICKIEYNINLFVQDSIVRMAKSFNNLITNILRAPDKPIVDHLLLDDIDYKTIVSQWNQTQVPIPKNDGIHTLFEKRVVISPHAIAIQYQDKSISYEELNNLSNQIAGVLLAKLNQHDNSTKKESLIAVCLERSPMMVATLLAIFKAGCGYVPMDTSYPFERIKNIIHQSQPVLFICSNQVLSNYPEINNLITDVLSHDEMYEQMIKQSITNPDLFVEPHQLAQIIFTSGSTGKPKGVMLEHKSIVNRLLWMQSQYPLSSKDKFLHKTPYIFDVSVGEIFWPLMAGAQLIIAEPEKHRDFFYLAELIYHHAVTHIHFIPTTLPVFLDIIKNGAEMTSLKCIFCSGEALSSLIEYEVLSTLSVDLHNIYGPTEAGEVSYYHCLQDIYPDLSVRPIGKPINNTKLYILDSALNPVPVSVPGDLYIAGECLARGYYNQPELTEQRFSYNLQFKERLYKTGDIAYWLPDGNIAYLGRDDFQVKIRGNRIELEEIENIISNYPNVKQCVVTVKTFNQEKYLVAYYKTAVNDHDILQSNKIENMLKEQVPEYMVPAYIIPVDIFPLTDSGKIDRKALPAPDFSPKQSVFLPPSNIIEYDLLLIWQHVLSTKSISTQNNFFTIGGHSLLAINLLTKINLHFNRRYPLSWIFNLNTIKKQAEAISDSLLQNEFYHPIVCFNDKGSRPPLIFIHPGRTGAEAYISMAMQLSEDIPFYALESYNIYCDTPILTVEELGTLYLSFIKKLIPQGPFYLGGWSLGGLIAYEIAQQIKQDNGQLQHLFLIDCSTYLSEARSTIEGMPSKYLDFLNTLPEETKLRYYVIPIENTMIKEYQPLPYLGKVTLFQATQEEYLSSVQWRPLVKQLHVCDIDADHFSIMETPKLQELISYIDKELL